MSDFMQPEITIKQDGWRVETDDRGTCFLPCDVRAVPDWLRRGVTVDINDTLVFNALVSLVSDYISARHIQSIEVCTGYFARLSAPGYLDCTDWCCYDTLHEARAALKEI